MADNSEFEKLVLADLDSFYRVAVALCHDQNQAEDLVQSSSLKAIKRFSSFKQGTNFKAWFIRIIRNTWYDELRHRKVVGNVVQIDDLPLPDEHATEEIVWSDAEDLLENFSDSQVIDALVTLPEDQRLALFLVDVEQLPQNEVAEIMDVPVGTIKSRTSRARAALSTKLDEYAHEYGYIK